MLVDRTSLTAAHVCTAIRRRVVIVISLAIVDLSTGLVSSIMIYKAW
jgi:hypothetical protein